MDSLVEDCRLDDAVMAPPWGQLGRAFTLGVVAGFSKLMLNVLNTTSVVNHEAYLKAVTERAPGTGLITVCNHTSLFDDPGVICAITPWSFFWTEASHQGNRWSLCAKEVCFKNELLRQFFQNGKVLPVLRGGGVTQPIMGTSAAAVARGDWLHVFPEGRVMFPGTLGPFRWGVGKVVCDAKRMAGGRDPMVLPFFHSNMGAVLPINSKLFRAGNDVTVTVGEPLDLSDITCRCNKEGEDQPQVWRDITLRMRKSLQELEARSPPNPYQGENPVRPGGAAASNGGEGTVGGEPNPA